jgi:hypothetical protein
MECDNWDLCRDTGLSHPLKWLQDNADAVNATAWGAEINAWVDSLPDELISEPAELSGDVICSRRYSAEAEPPLPTPARPAPVDDADTLSETWRLKQEERHNAVRPPVKKASWEVAPATPPLDLGELKPLSW